MYSVDGPFQLVHEDIPYLRFLGKSATHRKYCLKTVDIYSAKLYAYMRQTDLLTKNLELFYNDIRSKRNKNKMQLQDDLEFQKNDITELNKKCNVEMFSTKIRGGKAFPAKQKIRRELKKRISKLRLIKSKSANPHKLIKMSVDNINKINTPRYGSLPDEIENRSLLSEKFCLGFNFDQIKMVSRVHNAIDKYDTKIYLHKKKNLRKDLAIGESVLILAERIKKSQPEENFTKA